MEEIGVFSQTNVADNQLSIMIKIFSKLKGWAFADKGFINQKAFEELFSKGLHLVTGIRKNMKNKLVGMNQKLLLKKRGVIESVNDILKTVCDIEHTRHRSPVNMLVNLYAGLCSYTWLDRLPSIFLTNDPKLTLNYGALLIGCSPAEGGFTFNLISKVQFRQNQYIELTKKTPSH